MFNFGPRSKEKLDTVEEKMRKVMTLAIQKSEVDFSILEGARTRRRQYELFAKGRSVAELRNANVPLDITAQPSEKKVTWTLNSKHFPPAGATLGRAVDVGVFPYDPDAPISLYVKIKNAVMAAAAELKIKVRWGGDWDGDGKTEHGENDYGHFELV